MRILELIRSYRDSDPATESMLEVFLFYPGVKASILHCCAHFFYKLKFPLLPRAISELARFLTMIDIHPGAQLGRRVLMDHGAGIVIGETAVVGDDVLIYQGVTLGGTSLERHKKRHPTIGNNCVIGAGAKVLGNITIGAGSRVGANSVVVQDVPAGSTVVGIPGKLVTSGGGVRAGQELEHGRLSDPLQNRINELERRLADLEKKA
jgi:serine O-acetyltransferase